MLTNTLNLKREKLDSQLKDEYSFLHSQIKAKIEELRLILVKITNETNKSDRFDSALQHLIHEM